jgi:hypothetical protein
MSVVSSESRISNGLQPNPPQLEPIIHPKYLLSINFGNENMHQFERTELQHNAIRNFLSSYYKMQQCHQMPANVTALISSISSKKETWW